MSFPQAFLMVSHQTCFSVVPGLPVRRYQVQSGCYLDPDIWLLPGSLPSIDYLDLAVSDSCGLVSWQIEPVFLLSTTRYLVEVNPSLGMHIAVPQPEPTALAREEGYSCTALEMTQRRVKTAVNKLDATRDRWVIQRQECIHSSGGAGRHYA